MDLFIAFRAWSGVMFPFDVQHLSRWGTDCFHQITYPSNKSANIFSDSSWLLSSSYLWPPGKTRETNIQMSLDEWLFMPSYYLLRKPYERLQLNMLWRLHPFLFAQAILYFPHLPAWLLWQLPWMFFAPKPGPEFRGEICKGQWSSPSSPYVFPRRPLDGAQESSLGSHDLCCGPRE